MSYIGEKSIGSNTSSNNKPDASIFTAGETFAAKRMVVYISGSNDANFMMAIYDDDGGEPGDKIINSAISYYPGVAGWYEIPISDASITNGVKYHLCVWFNESSPSGPWFHKKDGGTDTIYSNSAASWPTWPDPFNQTSTISNGPICIYADNTVTQTVTAKASITKTVERTQTIDVKANILHYCSPRTAQSTTIKSLTGDDQFTRATLTAVDTQPAGTSITYYLSADGGSHWEEVTSGVEHTFTNTGQDLRWRAVLSTTDIGITPEIETVSVDWLTTLTRTKTIIAQASIKKLITQSAQAKARIQQTRIKTIQAKGRITIISTQIVDAKARIQKLISQTIEAKGRIQITSTQALTAQGRIQKSFSQTISVKGRIEKEFTQSINALARITITTIQAITAKGKITATATQAVEAKGRITITTSQTIEAKARITSIQTQAIQALGRITQTFSQTIEAFGRIQTITIQTITAFGRITATIIQIVSAKSAILKSFTQTISALARITVVETQTIEAKANIIATLQQTINAKGMIGAPGARIVNAKGNIRATFQQIVEAKAAIKELIEKTISAKARIVCISIPELVSPTIGALETSPVYLVWKIPSCCKNRNIHCHVQVDKTDNTFNDLEKDLYSFKDSGFEYWDGDSWEPYPIAGAGSAYYGNQARVQVSLTQGTKYWRVRGAVK